MRKPIDPRKIVALMQYHVQIMEKFRAGTLEGKVSVLMKRKAIELEVSIESYYRHRRKSK